jgi:hypothetical protein
MSSKSPEQILKTALELHAHDWLSFKKWDELSLEVQESFIARARSGRMYADTTKDGYIPEGMTVVPYSNSNLQFKEFKPIRHLSNREILEMEESKVSMEEKPQAGAGFFNSLTEEEKSKIMNIPPEVEKRIKDTPAVKRRGRPPGSKNKGKNR